VWYRVAGELDPSRPVPAETMAEPNQSQGEGRALSIRQAADGHYYVNARINGADMRLLVDTGATVTVLSVRQAERAGIFPSQSEFTATVRTASGMARAAPVRIRDLQIGDARLEDVPALVMDTPRDLSVLGVGTLQRFKSYEVRDGVLTLKW
jgi:aspartyl protease family protein